MTVRRQRVQPLKKDKIKTSLRSRFKEAFEGSFLAKFNEDFLTFFEIKCTIER